MFNWAKAIGKFFIGAFGTGAALVFSNPAVITDLIPEHIATMTVGGIVVEVIDYIHNRLSK